MGFKAVFLKATYPNGRSHNLKVILLSNVRHLYNPQDHLLCSWYAMYRYTDFQILYDTRIN